MWSLAANLSAGFMLEPLSIGWCSKWASVLDMKGPKHNDEFIAAIGTFQKGLSKQRAQLQRPLRTRGQTHRTELRRREASLQIL